MAPEPGKKDQLREELGKLVRNFHERYPIFKESLRRLAQELLREAYSKCAREARPFADCLKEVTEETKYGERVSTEVWGKAR